MESISENQNLTALEEIIADGQMSFERIGDALKKIREQELYKPNYSSFNAYTKNRWNMQRRKADYLIQSVEFMSLLRQHNCSQLPTCESQIRPLSQLTIDQQLEAWQAVLKEAESGKKITANLIAKVAKNIKQQNEPEPTYSLKLTSNEKKILSSLQSLDRISTGILREFIFSNNGEFLKLPVQATNLLKKLQMLELEHNYELSPSAVD